MVDAHRFQRVQRHAQVQACPPHGVRGMRRFPMLTLTSLPPKLPSEGESPDDYAVREELSRAIQSALMSLPEERRLTAHSHRRTGLQLRRGGAHHQCERRDSEITSGQG